MEVYKKTVSYQQFRKIYETMFDKFDKSEDTIFENASYRPPVDEIYKRFIHDPAGHSVWIDIEEQAHKIKYIKSWIASRVFFETTAEVEHQLLQESETLPIHIEYKINNSYEKVLEELDIPIIGGALGAVMGGAKTGASSAAAGAVGGAVAKLSTVTLGLGTKLGILAGYAGTMTLLVPDQWKKNIQEFAKNVGEFIGRVVTLDFDKFGPLASDKEILKLAKAQDLADGIKECARMHNFDASKSFKAQRVALAIANNHSEYEYARCIGKKLIGYYINMIETLYKILLASDSDHRAIDAYRQNLSMGILGLQNMKNVGRLIRDRKIYTLFKNFEHVSQALYEMIDTFMHSKDREYVRIGFELSKDLEGSLRTVLKELQNVDKKLKPQKPPMNREDRHSRPPMNRDNRDNREDRNRDQGRERRPF